MSKEIKIVPFPDKPQEYVQGVDRYVMGIDAGGYDAKTFAVCVIKKADDNMNEIVATYYGRSEVDYAKEVERLTKYYNTPDNCILKEVNKGE